MAEELTYLKRTGVGGGGGDGPPKWIPFGQKLSKHNDLVNVKAKVVPKVTENKEENDEFNSQRKDAIQGKGSFSNNWNERTILQSHL